MGAFLVKLQLDNLRGEIAPSSIHPACCFGATVRALVSVHCIFRSVLICTASGYVLASGSSGSLSSASHSSEDPERAIVQYIKCIESQVLLAQYSVPDSHVHRNASMRA